VIVLVMMMTTMTVTQVTVMAQRKRLVHILNECKNIKEGLFTFLQKL